MLKIAFVLQARLKSTRLPCKSALTLSSGKNCVSEAIHRLKNYNLYSGTNYPIILACPNDEIFYFRKIVSEAGCEIYGGDPIDLSSRFYNLIKMNKLGGVIRVTGDNPYICYDVIDFLVSKITNNVDQCISLYHQKQIPNGTVASFLGSDYIKLVSERGCEKSREHLVISDNSLIQSKIIIPEIPAQLIWPMGRFCLDNLEDYEYLLSNEVLNKFATIPELKDRLTIRKNVREY